MNKPTFQPRAGAGTAFQIDKMKERSMDRKEQIKKLILEEGNLPAALALAGPDVTEAIRRALKIHEDADDEGGTGEGQCSLDFGEIVRSAETMTKGQVEFLILIAGLLKGIFSMPYTSNPLDFISM